MFRFLDHLPRWQRLAVIFPILFLNGFLLVLLINYLQPLIHFLITAAILAFLLELLVQGLQQRGIKRGWAIAISLLLTLLTLVLLGLIIFPIMADQLNQLIEKAPLWINETNQHLKTLPRSLRFQNALINLSDVINEAAQRLSNSLESIGNQLITILLGTINGVINTLIVLILTIFLLIGGEKFWDGLFSWLPFPWDQRIRVYLRKTFKDYFFSRVILAGISSLVRAVIFAILGVPYAILFAFGIGIASLIPFVAGLVILVTTILLSFYDPGLGIKFFLAAFIIDQVTDNVVAPRLMGEMIGLNPIWILISLFIGAKMGGILGLLLAVPLASVIKRIVADLRAEAENREEAIGNRQ